MLEKNRSDVEQYINKILSGEIPACKKLKKTINRYLEDRKRIDSDPNCPYYFDDERANRVIEFCELLVHVKGEKAKNKEKFLLSPWQKFIIWCLYGFINKKTDTRRFRRAYIQVARKNGKTFFASALCLYHMYADNEAGAEVYTLGPESKTAMVSYGMARKIIQKIPDLNDITECKQYEVYYGDNILTYCTGDPDANEARSASFALVDEYHIHRSNGLYQAMIEGMGARSQPLLVCITTAGNDLNRPCYTEEYEYSTRILDNVVQDDSYFSIIYELDHVEEFTDLTKVQKANPNYGISVYEDFINNQIIDAVNNPLKRNSILTKNFNVWVNSGSRFISTELWNKNKGDHSLEDFAGLTAYGGLDLSKRHDLTCVAFDVELNGIHNCIEHYFIPAEGLAEKEKKDRFNYSYYAEKGYITISDSPVVNYQDVINYLLECQKILNIEGIQYDPWNSSDLISQLEDLDFNMLVKSQGKLSMSAPVKNWNYELLQSNFRYSNPITDWCASNVEVKEDVNNNIQLCKPKTGGARESKKIDGIVASIIAYDLWYSMKNTETNKQITLGDLITSSNTQSSDYDDYF